MMTGDLLAPNCIERCTRTPARCLSLWSCYMNHRYDGRDGLYSTSRQRCFVPVCRLAYSRTASRERERERERERKAQRDGTDRRTDRRTDRQTPSRLCMDKKLRELKTELGIAAATRGGTICRLRPHRHPQSFATCHL